MIQGIANPEPSSFLHGKAALIIAVIVVILLFVGLPAYRWLFVGSVVVGLIVAGILFFWHKYRPVKEADVRNKRPLGLD
jgi:hypothetical protein